MLFFYARSHYFAQVVVRVESILLNLPTWLAVNRLIDSFICNVLERVSRIKYPDLILDDSLDFGLHVDRVCQRLSKVFVIKHSVSNHLTTDALLSFHYSLAYSHLIQSIISWVGAVDSKCNPVQVTLNTLLRVILRVRRKSRTTHTDRWHVQKLVISAIWCLLLHLT